MNFPFEYTHKTNKRAKSITIKVEQGGKVVVSTPKLVPKFIINQFVKKNESWIVAALSKATQKEKFNSDTQVTIFGKKYQKEIISSNKQKSGIFVEQNKLIFNPIIEFNKISLNKINNTTDLELNKKFKKKLDDFLKSTAGHYITKRTYELAKKMNLKFNNITLRKQKTRWGSCSSQKNLNFNWKLVHFDTSIIDYVIIHELSHLIYMDHSKSFWNLVNQYDPDHLKHRGWLKRNGLNLD